MQTDSYIQKTVQGEAWDLIAKKKYGSEYDMHVLLAENPDCLDTLFFSGNKEIRIPKKEKTAVKIPAVWE